MDKTILYLQIYYSKKYKNKFKDANSLMKKYGKDKLGAYTRALTGEYTRPGTIHLDRREKATRRIYKKYMKWIKKNASSTIKSA